MTEEKAPPPVPDRDERPKQDQVSQQMQQAQGCAPPVQRAPPGRKPLFGR